MGSHPSRARKTFRPLPSHALKGEETKKVQPGHGKIGYVALNVTVSPEVKTALIERALRNQRWLMDEVREAVEKHLNEEA